MNLTYSGETSSLSTLYGGTYALFAHTFPQYGIDFASSIRRAGRRRGDRRQDQTAIL